MGLVRKSALHELDSCADPDCASFPFANLGAKCATASATKFKVFQHRNQCHARCVKVTGLQAVDWLLPVASFSAEFRSVHCRACAFLRSAPARLAPWQKMLFTPPCHSKTDQCRSLVQIQSQVPTFGQQPARCDAACLFRSLPGYFRATPASW